jgi:ketosteroid isomerase-like protein
MNSALTEVSTLFDTQRDAIAAKNLDLLMSLYSPDIAYFDVVPPLQWVGSVALRGRFEHWFDGYEGPIRLDTRDLAISLGGDIAVVHGFSRAAGTLKNGREIGSWVRTTSCCARSSDGWLITHEHVSLPVDMASGSARLDLVPE